MDANSLATANAYVSTIQKLATVPAVAQRVLDALMSDKASGQALGEIIARDPSLTATVLKHANAPMYGARRQVKEIAQAVVMLGFAQTAQLAMAASVIDLFGQSRDEQTTHLWHCRMMIAAAASRLARNILGDSDSASVFVAGLLHDIGRSIVQLKDPAVYKQIYASEPSEKVAYAAVDLALGCHPGEIGNALARRWNLSEDVALTALLHHDATTLDTVGMDPTITPTVWLVMAAKLLTHDVNGWVDPASLEAQVQFFATRESIAPALLCRFLPAWQEVHHAFKSSLEKKAA